MDIHSNVALKNPHRYKKMWKQNNAYKNEVTCKKITVSILDSFEILSTKDHLPEENRGGIGELSRELSRERDMLLEQVELLKNEQNFSMHVHEADENTANDVLAKERDDLLNENGRMKRELEILRQVYEDKDVEGSHDEAISKLLCETKELRHENMLLRRKAVRQNGSVVCSWFI